MLILKTADEMQLKAFEWEQKGRKIGLVPTMGYLHEGHLALMRRCRKVCDIMVASIYVNPTQFNNSDDLEHYPRDEENDLAKCWEVGCDAVYFPTNDSMYPEGYKTYVNVEDLTDILCGASRPGHFRGVTTVVCKLFNIVRSRVAVFGEKDFQQLAVIKRMVKDLDMPVEVLSHPTVREADGIAMSSRNARLSADERINALSISKALAGAREAVLSGVSDSAILLGNAEKTIMNAGCKGIDYLEIRHPESFELQDSVLGPAVMLVAAHFGSVRLIDNLRLL